MGNRLTNAAEAVEDEEGDNGEEVIEVEDTMIEEIIEVEDTMVENIVEVEDTMIEDIVEVEDTEPSEDGGEGDTEKQIEGQLVGNEDQVQETGNNPGEPSHSPSGGSPFRNSAASDTRDLWDIPQHPDTSSPNGRILSDPSNVPLPPEVSDEEGSLPSSEPPRVNSDIESPAIAQPSTEHTESSANEPHAPFPDAAENLPRPAPSPQRGQRRSRRIRSQNPSPESAVRRPQTHVPGQPIPMPSLVEEQQEQQEQAPVLDNQIPTIPPPTPSEMPSTPPQKNAVPPHNFPPGYRDSKRVSDTDSSKSDSRESIVDQTERLKNQSPRVLSDDVVSRLNTIGRQQRAGSPSRVPEPKTGGHFVPAATNPVENLPSLNNAGIPQPVTQGSDGSAIPSHMAQTGDSSGLSPNVGVGWGSAVSLAPQVPQHTGFAWATNPPQTEGSGDRGSTGPPIQPGAATGKPPPSLQSNVPAQSTYQPGAPSGPGSKTPSNTGAGLFKIDDSPEPTSPVRRPPYVQYGRRARQDRHRSISRNREAHRLSTIKERNEKKGSGQSNAETQASANPPDSTERLGFLPDCEDEENQPTVPSTRPMDVDPNPFQSHRHENEGENADLDSSSDADYGSGDSPDEDSGEDSKGYSKMDEEEDSTEIDMPDVPDIPGFEPLTEHDRLWELASTFRQQRDPPVEVEGGQQVPPRVDESASTELDFLPDHEDEQLPPVTGPPPTVHLGSLPDYVEEQPVVTQPRTDDMSSLPDYEDEDGDEDFWTSTGPAAARPLLAGNLQTRTGPTWRSAASVYGFATGTSRQTQTSPGLRRGSPRRTRDSNAPVPAPAPSPYPEGRTDSGQQDQPHHVPSTPSARVTEETQHQFPSPPSKVRRGRGTLDPDAQKRASQSYDQAMRLIKNAELAGIPTRSGAVYLRYQEPETPSQTEGNSNANVERPTRGVRLAFDPARNLDDDAAIQRRSSNNQSLLGWVNNLQNVSPQGTRRQMATKEGGYNEESHGTQSLVQEALTAIGGEAAPRESQRSYVPPEMQRQRDLYMQGLQDELNQPQLTEGHLVPVNWSEDDGHGQATDRKSGSHETSSRSHTRTPSKSGSRDKKSARSDAATDGHSRRSGTRERNTRSESTKEPSKSPREQQRPGPGRGNTIPEEARKTPTPRTKKLHKKLSKDLLRETFPKRTQMRRMRTWASSQPKLSLRRNSMAKQDIVKLPGEPGLNRPGNRPVEEDSETTSESEEEDPADIPVASIENDPPPVEGTSRRGAAVKPAAVKANTSRAVGPKAGQAGPSKAGSSEAGPSNAVASKATTSKATTSKAASYKAVDAATGTPRDDTAGDNSDSGRRGEDDGQGLSEGDTERISDGEGDGNGSGAEEKPPPPPAPKAKVASPPRGRTRARTRAAATEAGGNATSPQKAAAVSTKAAGKAAAKLPAASTKSGAGKAAATAKKTAPKKTGPAPAKPQAPVEGEGLDDPAPTEPQPTQTQKQASKKLANTKRANTSIATSPQKKKAPAKPAQQQATEPATQTQAESPTRSGKISPAKRSAEPPENPAPRKRGRPATKKK